MIGSFVVQRCNRHVLALLAGVLLAGGCSEKAPGPEQLMAAARQEREKGHHSAAIIHLKNVLQKAPDNAEARFLLGTAYGDAGDFASAEKELRRALELRYDPAKVTPPLGRALLALGEFQKVLDQARVEPAADDRTQAEILTLRGMASIGLKRNREGGELLAQALAKQPEFADALLGQARLAAAEKNLDEAARLIDRALASAPKNADAWLMKGDLARATKQDAAAAYQKALEINPEHVPARVSMASLLIAAGNAEEARKHLEQARKVAPNSPILTYMTGLIEFRQGNYPAAREAVLRVLKVAPNHMPSVLLAGSVEYALGSHVQAQTYLARVVERAPANIYARKLLVSSLAKTGQTQRALEVLEPGLKSAPNDAGLMALAGEVALQNNDLARAGQYFERAAKLDPKSASARTGLAMSRLATGETDSGLADLETAVQLDTEKYQADILLVMSHLQRAQYDQALKALQSLEKKQPNNPLTYNLKAAIYLGKKDAATARKHLERALELQPSYVPAALNLAQLDLADKNPQAARRRFEAILERDRNNVQALLALANLGARLGATPKEQIEWLESARRASPTALQPKLLLARFYAQTGDVKQALGVAQQALVAHPDNAEVLDTLGSVQIAAGEKNQALATYNKLATLQPKSHMALYRLANAQVLNSDSAGAAGSLRKALALKPDFIEAQAALAELEIRAGRHPEALKIAREVQKRSAKSPVGYALEGEVLMAEKKFLPAAKAYDTAYGLGRSGALAMRAHAAYAQAGKPDEAETRLAQWLKVAPDDAIVQLYAADASLKSGKYPSAIGYYEALLQKQPENLVVLNNLAWVYQQVKDKRALETAERAYKLKPDNPAIADTLGWILVEQGDAARALPLLQGAVKAAPKAAAIRYHLAQALLKAGDKAKARDELERLLVEFPEFPEHAQAMAILKGLRK